MMSVPTRSPTLSLLPCPLPGVVIIGAGGHAKVVIEALRAAGFPPPLGLVDPHPPAASVLGLPVLGGDEVLERLRGEGAAAVVALGGNALRQEVGGRLLALGYALPAVVHPAAQRSPSALVEGGAVVMARACIGPEARIGHLAIVNTGAVIEHDTVLGRAAHVAPGCALAGAVTVGDRALVGVGSAVRPGIAIGADAVVGAGSAVVRDVPAGARVGGVPAVPLRCGRDGAAGPPAPSGRG